MSDESHSRLPRMQPDTATEQCMLCHRLDSVNNLDWIGRTINGVEFVTYGHIPGEGCNKILDVVPEQSEFNE